MMAGMLGFVVRRVAGALPPRSSRWSSYVFIARVLPGDPALAILGDQASE